MNKISHSKYKNSGILFELLVRKITNETITTNESKAIGILKKYFTNTEISKENRLYQTLISSQNLTESKANNVINTISELSSRLDRKKLNSEKYNLIKEIKNSYDIEDFFKASLDNYKVLASIYTLIESNFVDNPNPNILISSKDNIIDYLVEQKLENETQIYQELSHLEKGERHLVYTVMLEKFNEKYDGLDKNQKNILKTYINNISNSSFLKEFINKEFNKLKSDLIENRSKIDDQVVTIKVNEIISLIDPILESKKMKDDYVVSLLQYTELNKEISRL